MNKLLRAYISVIHFTLNFIIDTCVPKGYVTFPPPAEETTPQLSYRDVTSPINMQDYALDSSGGRGKVHTMLF